MAAITTENSTPGEEGDKTYHHGDLPDALRAATAELITEKGPTGFSLREVARRAGVSHSAPAHHFGDSRGLLTSVATEGFQIMVDMFEERTAIADPVERLNAMGKAYVRIALNHPGHFGVMCSHELINEDDEEFAVVSIRAFELLLGTVSAIAAAHNPNLNIDAAAMWVWSGVHGFAVLAPGFDGMDDKAGTSDLDVLLDQFTDLITGGLFTATAGGQDASLPITPPHYPPSTPEG